MLQPPGPLFKGELLVKRRFITLRVYDITGKIMATLAAGDEVRRERLFATYPGALIYFKKE